MKAAVGILAFLAIIAAACGFFIFQQMMTLPGPLEQEKIIFIEPGSSVKKIAHTLAAENAIDAEWVFVLGARLRQSEGSLKAGEYALGYAPSPADIITLLQSGKTYQRQVTIPEGLMSFEIIELVNAAEAMTGEITDIPEQGSLLPETYSYTRGEDRNKSVTRMKKAMEDTLKELWEKRDPATLLKSPEEAVILASVVEKETGVRAERARVAGVFINRLKTGMPLQTDPTVIYAITEGKTKLDRPLLRKDLNIESPYNTYLHAGLPPTPISNPGRASLEAVLHPEAHDFIYFVADGTGGHAFAISHDEHLRNVSEWREIQNGSK